MILGPDFAIGHIPKTGGDALHAWFAALQDSRLTVDRVSDPAKHDPFAWRPAAGEKACRVLAIRRLPDWTLSFMRELRRHPAMLNAWGLRDGDALKRNGLLHNYADFHLRRIAGGTPITHWLRTEQLFTDFVAFVEEHLGPLDKETVTRLATVPTKGRADIAAGWTAAETERLYAFNPEWAAVERRVYGEIR